MVWTEYRPMSRGTGSMTWMLQIGQSKCTECYEIRNCLLNVIVVTWVKRKKEQTAFIDGLWQPFTPPYCKVFFLWHPLEFNRFNRYRKYRNRIGSLQTSIDIEAKIKYSPNLRLTTLHRKVVCVINVIVSLNKIRESITMQSVMLTHWY